jgi:hypothetical protein
MWEGKTIVYHQNVLSHVKGKTIIYHRNHILIQIYNKFLVDSMNFVGFQH